MNVFLNRCDRAASRKAGTSEKNETQGQLIKSKQFSTTPLSAPRSPFTNPFTHVTRLTELRTGLKRGGNTDVVGSTEARAIRMDQKQTPRE